VPYPSERKRARGDGFTSFSKKRAEKKFADFLEKSSCGRTPGAPLLLAGLQKGTDNEVKKDADLETDPGAVERRDSLDREGEKEIFIYLKGKEKSTFIGKGGEGPPLWRNRKKRVASPQTLFKSASSVRRGDLSFSSGGP